MSRIQHKIIQHTEPRNEVNSQRKRQFTDANLKTVQMLGISDKGFKAAFMIILHEAKVNTLEMKERKFPAERKIFFKKGSSRTK